MGIQFGWALQMANMSSIYEFLGAKSDEIPLLWLAAPLTGLIVQPIIGYLSDRTWHPTFGRRRPYFMIGAILSSIALVLMPNCSELWMAAGLLWILDSSINISMEPFRAFVADNLPEEQRTFGFSMQSLFIGLGSVVASSLPWIFTNWIGIKDAAGHVGIPSNVKWSFYIGAAAFLLFVLYTVLTSKEYPPSEPQSDAPKKEKKSGVLVGLKEIFEAIMTMPKRMRQLAVVQFLTWPGLFLMWFYYTPVVGETFFKGVANRPIILDIAEVINMENAENSKVSELQKQRKKNAANAKTQERRELAEYAKVYIEKVSFNERPVQLNECLVNNQLDTLRFYELLETSKILNDQTLDSALITANYSALKNDVLMNLFDNKLKERYKSGVEYAGLTYSFQNLITFIFALFLPLLASAFGNKTTHQICLTIGGLGLMSIWLFSLENSSALFFVMGAVGIAWASILSMPYSMLAGCLPSDKIGVYMGIFNFFIVLPEIIATLFFGWVMKEFLNNERTLALLVGGTLLILAGILTMRISETKNS